MALLGAAQTVGQPAQLIDGKGPYFASIRERWAEQLRKVFNELPDPGYWR